MTFLNFLNPSYQKDNSGERRNKAFLSSPTNITPELAQELLKFVNPVTLSSTDLQGRTIQLWSYKNELVASLMKDGEITLIPGDRICNSLQPNERGESLLNRLESSGLRKWQFAYVQGKISVWPHLIAAGKDGQSPWKPPLFPQEKQKLAHIFNRRGKEGHFTQDTPPKTVSIFQEQSEVLTI